MDTYNQWEHIADNYEKEREVLSFPALLLDDLVVSMISRKAKQVLDYGAGSGAISRRLKKAGFSVIAYEPIKIMRDLCRKMTPEDLLSGIKIFSSLHSIAPASLDAIICVNVLNHIDRLEPAVKKIHALLKSGGQLIVVIPHPFKDSGHWHKSGLAGNWRYDYYVAGDYMKEGVVVRTREDVNGNVVVKKATMNHRKVATYFNILIKSGFRVEQLIEPGPKNMSKKKFPVLHEKSSRIPYFLVMECRK